MPMWRCPHCGTPQAETARCWVCQRSTTNCGTCRHFRRSVAAQLGYCGLDRKRQALDGNEIRGCWEAWPAGEARSDVALTIGPARSADHQHRHLEFIEVGAALEEAENDGAVPAAMPSREPGWSLWDDADR